MITQEQQKQIEKLGLESFQEQIEKLGLFTYLEPASRVLRSAIKRTLTGMEIMNAAIQLKAERVEAEARERRHSSGSTASTKSGGSTNSTFSTKSTSTMNSEVDCYSTDETLVFPETESTRSQLKELSISVPYQPSDQQDHSASVYKITACLHTGELSSHNDQVARKFQDLLEQELNQSFGSWENLSAFWFENFFTRPLAAFVQNTINPGSFVILKNLLGPKKMHQEIVLADSDEQNIYHWYFSNFFSYLENNEFVNLHLAKTLLLEIDDVFQSQQDSKTAQRFLRSEAHGETPLNIFNKIKSLGIYQEKELTEYIQESFLSSCPANKN